MRPDLPADPHQHIVDAITHENHNRINVFAKRATRMPSGYLMLDQNSAADPVLGTRMESRLAPRSDSRRSASVTSCVAIPSRLPSGATASLYRFPRQSSQAAIIVATILPSISAIIGASLLLFRRQAILSELSVSLGRAPDNCQSSSIETASSGRPLRMLASSPTLRATFLHNILRTCDSLYASGFGAGGAGPLVSRTSLPHPNLKSVRSSA